MNKNVSSKLELFPNMHRFLKRKHIYNSIFFNYETKPVEFDE